ncbi:MAG: hypothetical protein WAN79_10835, partial [Opitutaceae bacterium]
MKGISPLESAPNTIRAKASPRRARSILGAALLSLTAVAAVHAQNAPITAPAPQPAAAAPADAFGVALPNWLTVASVSVREGYDSNIYGVSDNLAGHPPIANISSWFTTLSANLTFDLLADA